MKKPLPSAGRSPRLRRVFVLLTMLGGLPSLRAAVPAATVPDALIPRPLAADRYQALAARSPFSPPSVEAPPPVKAPPPPSPGWGDKYTLGGLAQFGAGYKVTLNPKNPVGAGASSSAGGNNVNPSERLIVITGQPNPDNIILAGVQWNDDPKQTRATLVKNGVPAVFNFDASAVTAARGNAASVPAPRNSSSGPGVIPAPSGFPAAPPFQGPAAGAPTPGIVQSPINRRAPIRPPPPATGPGGIPLVAPPPTAPVRLAPLAAPPVPGNASGGDDD